MTVLHGRSIALAAILGACVVAGCAGVAPGGDREDYWYVLPDPGSRVELEQPVSARSGARISIQNGEVRRWSRVAKWRPYCQFRVKRPSGQMSEPLQIEPDSFTVERAYRRKDLVDLEGRQYAFLVSEGEDFDNSPSQRTMATYMELSSQGQPHVYRLVCARWADPYDYNHVSIQEIRQTLDGVARLATN